MLEKAPGILVALPDGERGHVEVWSNKRSALTKEAVKKIIEVDTDFRVIGFKRREQEAVSR